MKQDEHQRRSTDVSAERDLDVQQKCSRSCYAATLHPTKSKRKQLQGAKIRDCLYHSHREQRERIHRTVNKLRRRRVIFVPTTKVFTIITAVIVVTKTNITILVMALPTILLQSHVINDHDGELSNQQHQPQRPYPLQLVSFEPNNMWLISAYSRTAVFDLL